MPLYHENDSSGPGRPVRSPAKGLPGGILDKTRPNGQRISTDREQPRVRMV